jgi:hypothetical protein
MVMMSFSAVQRLCARTFDANAFFGQKHNKKKSQPQLQLATSCNSNSNMSHNMLLTMTPHLQVAPVVEEVAQVVVPQAYALLDQVCYV